jgi:hypothetical protein
MTIHDYQIFVETIFIEVVYRVKRNTNEPCTDSLSIAPILKCVNCTISTPSMTLDKASRAQELLAELIATRGNYTVFAAEFDTRDRARKILSCLIILSTRGKDRTVCGRCEL